ncbi:DUF4352 domain-containing protein [Rummeliibacillus sp. BSL5]
MKKLLSMTLICLCFATLTAGCSFQSNSSTDTHVEAASNKDYLKTYQPNPQVTDDRTLLKTADDITDKRGYAKLESLNLAQKNYKLGDITLTIRDVKKIHLEPTYSMMDYFHVLTQDETFSVVKAFVEITNNSDKSLLFSPVGSLTANTGQKWTFEHDIYLDDLTGEIKPHETKKGNIGYILENGSNPREFTLQTSDIFDKKEQKVAAGTKIILTLPK